MLGAIPRFQSVNMLLYRGSDHGFCAKRFHELCDDKGPSLAVVKANNNIFGIFTEYSWQAHKTYEPVDRTNTFRFHFKDGTLYKYPHLFGPPILSSSIKLLVAGGFNILDKCHMTDQNYAIAKRKNQQISVNLAGINTFKVQELELYKITLKDRLDHMTINKPSFQPP